MTQSFGIVEEKLQETEFFLQRLRLSDYLSTDARFYFSAFVSAARNVTLALQATMSGVPGFEPWYQDAQAQLKTDPLAPFFVEIRNQSIHRGLNPLNQITTEHLRDHMFRQMHTKNNNHVMVLPGSQKNDPSTLVNAVEVSETYFVSIVRVIFDCYQHFKCVVDPRWYFTCDNFLTMGKTLEDALTELGFPPDWLSCAPDDPEGSNVWRILRSQQPSCLINDLFWKYLKQEIAGPDDLIMKPVDA